MSVALLTCAATAAGATHLTVRERAVVGSSVVRLGDVADVAAADRTQGRQLAAVPLMPAPPAGTERFLTKREVEDLLSAHGYDLGDFEIEGAAQIAISVLAKRPADRVAGTLSQPTNRHAAILAGHIDVRPPAACDELAAGKHKGELNRTIARYLEAQTGRMEDWQVTCDVPERHLVLLGEATSPVVCQGGREPWLGRQRFVVSFTTRQSNVQIPVYADVANASAQVAVAMRPIARGEVITAADVEMQSVEAAPPTGRRSAIDSLEQLVGLEAKQAIQVGDLIFPDHVQAPILVKRGEEISVVSQSGGIRVRTTARARQDGARGQLVQVETLETKERYDVRVVGLREAAVFSAVNYTTVEPSAKQVETARR